MQTASSSKVKTEPRDGIAVGSVVEVRFPDGTNRFFTITSETRAVAPDKGIISDRSPLGAALLRKKVGESVVFSAGGQRYSAEVVGITSVG